MLAIRNPDAVGRISHAHIRELVELRFAALGEYEGPYRPDTHGWFVVLDAEDDPASTPAVGCPELLRDDDGVIYGQAGFLAYEWGTDYGDCYELIRVVGGVAIAIFIPKPVQHSDLLKLCESLTEFTPQ